MIPKIQEYITLFYPYKSDWVDASQNEKGNGDFTDFLSWLLNNVGYGNYKIKFIGNSSTALYDLQFHEWQFLNDRIGWEITFFDPRQAMLFKLYWL